MKNCLIIGGAVIDVSISCITPDIFAQHSIPVDDVRIGTGGDALNEATVLARLGYNVSLLTKLGRDSAADMIRAHCEQVGIRLLDCVDPTISTSVNIVGVTEDGERSFITVRDSSLRKLSYADIEPFLSSDVYVNADIICLASLFVSPALTHDDCAKLFRRFKADGKIVCCDTTRRKNNESVEDIAEILSNVDYFFPNLEEAELLTGTLSPADITNRFLEKGVGTVLLKLGKRGCLLAEHDRKRLVSAVPSINCIDSTGAGDTFAAAFISGLADGLTNDRCAVRANATASCCIETRGANNAVFDRDTIIKRETTITVTDWE
ncbi:MAG: carbohydrate kinase family protein [Clostridia bacterium]|nr:carbohydrate kinase family protein [Clostridia bacterium]